MLNQNKPTKSLLEILPKQSGRDNTGQVSIRHQGGRHKRFYRLVDFTRKKTGVPAKVASIEYDPNRSTRVALLTYADGEKSYIIAPVGLKTGDSVISSPEAEIKPGNSLPLVKIPVGTLVHNIELVPGRGARIVRSAGSAATVLAKEGNFVHVKLPSGEIRKISGQGLATIGQVGNIERRNIQIGKAGRARHMGKRPEVRGVAQNPRSHPHGGGEGRSGIGMPSPKSPWGKRTLGRKTRKPNKFSEKFIIQKRK